MQRVQRFLATLLKDSVFSVDVGLSELTDIIGWKPMLLKNIFDTPDLWGTIGEIGAELKEHSVKTTANLTYKCDQTENKCQMLIQVAATEDSMLY